MSAKVKLFGSIKNSFSRTLLHSRNYSTGDAVKTALYDLHSSRGGKIVDFGGYLLPVIYSTDSITTSHLHTRQHASLFDVSHMLQTKIHGKDRVEFIERLTTADVRNLAFNKAALTVFTDKNTGGILDDLIVTNSSDGYLYVVSNAGRRGHDIKHMLNMQDIMKSEKKDVIVELLETKYVSLVALQGPKSVLAVQQICDSPINQLPFMSSTIATIGGIEGCRISRCGYTGEDGFEISVPSSSVESLVTLLLDSKVTNVKLAGLGARDSLRLEAGLCLYGNDIDENTTPVEASLSWLIPKTRREKKDFPGAEIICRQLKEGVSRKRIGLTIDGGAPARQNSQVESLNGDKIGIVTSGVPSPSLKYNIAMAYLDSQFCKLNTQVQVVVRGKKSIATVVKMPFLPTNYYLTK